MMLPAALAERKADGTAERLEARAEQRQPVMLRVEGVAEQPVLRVLAEPVLRDERAVQARPERRTVEGVVARLIPLAQEVAEEAVLDAWVASPSLRAARCSSVALQAQVVDFFRRQQTEQELRMRVRQVRAALVAEVELVLLTRTTAAPAGMEPASL